MRYKRLANKWRVICVSDAYKLMPWADALYTCDNRWWSKHAKCEGFQGVKWSTHETDSDPSMSVGNDKRAFADDYGITLVKGRGGAEFSFDPEFINYGLNSGFQAVNLALLLGCRRIVLVGFDMRHVSGKAHCEGYEEHWDPSPDKAYVRFAKQFESAAKRLPADVKIINATHGSVLTCFPIMSLEDACREIVPGLHDRVHSDGPEFNAAAG